MKKTKSLLLSTPYLVWMVVFTLIPLGVVAYYALTAPATGVFSLGNVKSLGMYLPVLWKSHCHDRKAFRRTSPGYSDSV